MRYVSMFSGIEAATVAFAPLGWTPVAFSEIDTFPSKVLAYHYPDVPNLGDVTQTDWSVYSDETDLVIGGSPCQAFSIAGLRRGLADPRGNLMLAFLRAARDLEPDWIIWENVPGVLSSNEGADFQAFLEAVAFFWPDGGIAWRVLDAQYFGLAQQRRRVFAVIHTRNWAAAPAVLFESSCLQGNSAPMGRGWEESASGVAGGHRVWSIGDEQAHAAIINDKASTLTASHSNQIITHGHKRSADGQLFVSRIAGALTASDAKRMNRQIQNTPGRIIASEGVPPRRLTPVECERLQGFPDDYTAIPGASDTARYKALGNTMAVPVIRALGAQIQHVTNQIGDNKWI